MAETKVILTKTVSNLGHSGDVVDVKSGYARNYLFPQGLAFAWTKGAEAQIVAMKRARLAKAVATREDAVAAKAAIEGTTVEIAAKVSESGKLFGGISNEAIAVALSDKAAVNPKAIEVETIKTTGDFPANGGPPPGDHRFLLREGRGRVSHSGLVLESHRPRV
jgi:Ribosomal protein L9, N-terminal domain